MYIVIVGNPMKGDEVKFYGPFEYDHANQWVSVNHPNEYTHIALLERI